MPALILVVDDETVVRHVLAKLTEHLGYRVMTASGGAEAVELCRSHAPAAVILDVRMPELDGPSTLDAPGLPHYEVVTGSGFVATWWVSQRIPQCRCP